MRTGGGSGVKITTEHYVHMKQAMAEVAARVPIAAYRAANPTFSEKRIRWDYSYAAKLSPWVCQNLYSYVNDEHIDTALRHIVAELEVSA